VIDDPSPSRNPPPFRARLGIALSDEELPLARWRAEALLALQRGVRLFDLGRGEGSELRAASLAAVCEAQPYGMVEIVSGAPSVESAPPTATELPPPPTQKPSRASGGLRRHREVAATSFESERGGAAAAAPLVQERAEGRIASWGIGYSDAPPTEQDIDVARAAGADWVAASLNLLSPTSARNVPILAGRRGLGFLARDPFAHGDLNGRTLRRSNVEAEPGPAPPRLASLQKEFRPVLRLGFLTEGRQRTLAQASLLAVQAVPGVVAVVADCASPEELIEAADALRCAPLSPEELRRAWGARGPER
jgi:hypothetical protein